MSRFFDEVDDRLLLADNARLTLPDGPWSLGGWVRLTDNIGTTFQYFLSWGAFGASPSINLFFAETTEATIPNKIRVVVIDSDGDGTNTGSPTNGISTATPGTSTAWQHVLLVRSGTSFSLYLNGSLDHTDTWADVNAIDVSGSLFFGGRSDLDANRFFGGQMADWFKVDAALSADEITALQRGWARRVLANRLTASTSWYVPMRDDIAQEIAGQIAATNAGSVAGASNPPIASYRRRAASFKAAAAAGGGLRAGSLSLMGVGI